MAGLYEKSILLKDTINGQSDVCSRRLACLWMAMRGAPIGGLVYPMIYPNQLPEISRFYGIVIKMFHNDHQPPHFKNVDAQSAIFGETITPSRGLDPRHIKR